MKNIRQDNEKTKRYLDSLPKLYVVGCWSKYGVREYPNSGLTDAKGVPLVWDYYDGNGTCSVWRLASVHHTTTGSVWCWSDNEDVCRHVASALNASEKGTLNYMGNYGITSYDAKEGKLKGYVFGHEKITFEAKSCAGIVNAFHKAVDEADGIVQETVCGENVKYFSQTY